MADTEKTEQPTGRRLAKAREEGSMPTSSELPGAVSLIVLTAMCYFMGPRVVRWAMQNMREGFSCDVTPCAEPGLLFAYMSERLIGAVMVGAPFLLALGIAGIMTQAAMHEFHLGGKFKLRFDLLNPSAVLKQFFSLQALVKLLLSIVKLSFVGTIALAKFLGRRGFDD